MKSKREIVEKVCKRYRKTDKSGKGTILDEFVKTTGYTRKYASWILAQWSKIVVTRLHGKVVRIRVGKRKAKPWSGRPRRYDSAFLAVLTELWFVFASRTRRSSARLGHTPALPAAAARALRLPGPGEELPLAHELGQTGRHG